MMGATAGLYAHLTAIAAGQMAAAAFKDEMAVGIGIGASVERSPRLAGFRAAKDAVQQLNGKPRRGTICFGDRLVPHIAEAIHGMQEVVGTGSVVVGVFTRAAVSSDTVTALALGGNVAVGVGLEHGFAPITKPWHVTRADDRRLYELDGQPAAAVYADYVGAGVHRYPLGITREPPQPGVTEAWGGAWAGPCALLRPVVAVSSDGSLACAGEVAEGAWVQVMISSRVLALEAASRAAQEAVRSLRTVSWVVVCESRVRMQLLGRESAEVFTRIQQIVGRSTPLLRCDTDAVYAGGLHGGALMVVAVGQ